MRADAEGKDDMMRRTRIAAATLMVAAGLIGAMAAPASAGVHKHDTRLTITFDFHRSFHGELKSKVHKCELRRRGVLFKDRRGADRKLGANESHTGPDAADDWWIRVHGPIQHNDRVYAKARRESSDGYVCRADRSETIRFPGGRTNSGISYPRV